MGVLKVSLQILWVGVWIFTGVGCGPDPRGRFEAEVRGMIGEVNAGRYGELEGVMSEGLKGRIRAEGWEPKAVLGVVARRDREERAEYCLRDVPKFEGKYAEAEIGRVVGGAGEEDGDSFCVGGGEVESGGGVSGWSELGWGGFLILADERLVLA